MSGGARRPRLLAIWLVLLALVGAIVIADRTRIFDSEPPPRTAGTAVFQFTEADLGSVEVLYKGRFAALMRDPDGQWFQHDASHSHSGAAAGADSQASETHGADPARAAVIAKQVSVTARMIADRRVKPDRGLDSYGLENPQTMIAFYGKAVGDDVPGRLDVLYVGDLLPTQYNYYAKREGEGDLLLIPRHFVALLLALMYGADQAPTALPPRRDATEN